MPDTRTVVLLVTLDTKGQEAHYVKEIIEGRGLRCLVVDPGVRGEPLFPADVSREQVAAAVGANVQTLAEARDRGKAADIMGQGAAKIVLDLYQRGELQGLLAIGGGTGSSIANPALAALPLGVPKMCVSTRSSFDYQASFERKDVTVVFSVTDVLGLNPILRQVLSNAAGAIGGMVEQGPVPASERPVVAMTSMGVTTPAAERCRELLLERGYEVIVFHASGAGGVSFEDLIRQRAVSAVLDLSPSSLPDDLVGRAPMMDPPRLSAAASTGIPQVVIPGALDFAGFRKGEIPEKYQERLIYYHTPTTALMRTNVDENRTLGRWLGERVGKSVGPAVVLIPKRGFSDYDYEGRVFWDPAADQAFVDAVQASIGENVPVEQVDLHVNDPEFAQVAVDTLERVIKQA